MSLCEKVYAHSLNFGKGCIFFPVGAGGLRSENWFLGGWGAKSWFLGAVGYELGVGASGAGVGGWVGPGLLAVVCGLCELPWK